jgi:putative membrane protein insertion efficiency factor
MEIRSITGSTEAGFPAALRVDAERGPVNRMVLTGIRFYKKWISHLLPMSCRFEPSCSRYAMECFEHWGTLRAARLSLQRLLRCHPFHPGGFDPVPHTRGKPTSEGRGQP